MIEVFDWAKLASGPQMWLLRRPIAWVAREIVGKANLRDETQLLVSEMQANTVEDAVLPQPQ